MNIAPTVLRRLLFLVLIPAISLTSRFLCAQNVPNPALVDSSNGTSGGLDAPQRRLKAAAELREEEQQRILGVMPNFNTTNVADAEPLNPGQNSTWRLRES